MADTWEQWRRKLSEDHPEVKPGYTNRLGIWHHDFDRMRPWQDEYGITHYPSQDYRVSVAGGIGGFNKADLLWRGWTRTAIRRVLGEPDNRMVRVGFRKDRPECIYDRNRVYQAEKAFAAARPTQGRDGGDAQVRGVRYRAVPNRRAPKEADEDRWYSYAEEAGIIVRACGGCWRDIEFSRSKVGRPPQYCSLFCRNRAAMARRRRKSQKK